MAGNTSSFTDFAEALNNEMRRAVLPVTLFVGLEAVCGFFGNLIVLYVFLFRYHLCNFRYFVLSLALIDITSSLITIPGEMVTQLYWYIYPEPMICKVKSFFNIFTVCAEGLCLLTIAVDRYRKVCRPLGWQIKHRAALLLCCVIFAVAFIFAIPVPFLWGTHEHQTMFEGELITVTVCEIDAKHLNTSSPLAYSISAQAIISICLFIMLCLYISVARTLFKSRSKSREASSTMFKLTYLKPAPKQDETYNDKGEVINFEYSSCNKTDAEFCVDFTQMDDANLNENRTTLSGPQINKSRISFSQSNTAKGIQTKEGVDTRVRRMQTKESVDTRVQRKTLIMFVLTVVFIATAILYLTLLAMIARADDALQEMTNSEKTVYFFFFRLYFINHVVNPVVYGLLDPQFRKAIQNSKKPPSISHITLTTRT